jgi:ribosome-binding factor A
VPKEFSRTERLGELIQRELAVLIQQEAKDPRLSMITVNDVVISKDLSNAKVYVTVLADEATIKQNITLLNKMAGFLRSQLSRRIKARMIPELKFIYDKTVLEGNRLAKLIDQALAKDTSKKSDSSE